MKKTLVILFTIIGVFIVTIVILRNRQGEKISMENEMFDEILLHGVEIKKVAQNEEFYTEKFDHTITNSSDIDSFVYFLNQGESYRFTPKNYRLSFDVYLKLKNTNIYKCQFYIIENTNWIYFNFFNLSKNNLVTNFEYRIRANAVESFIEFLRRRILIESTSK